jgi:hypothetical protein
MGDRKFLVITAWGLVDRLLVDPGPLMEEKEMVSSLRLWVPSGLFLLASLAMGCNMMAMPFFLIPGMEPKYEAKCKLASSDKEKTVTAVILASSGLETRPEFIRVDRELSRLLSQKLQEAFKRNKENVVLVPISKVERYKDEHPNWHSMAPEDIGKYFNAEYVIDLEIESISLYEPGNGNTLFRGRARISVDVVEVKKATEGPIYKEEYSIEYPKAWPQSANFSDDSNAAQFRLAFLTKIAQELSWRFTAHLVDDDMQIETK